MEFTPEQQAILADAIKRYQNSPDKQHGMKHVTRVHNVAQRLASSYPEVNKEDVMYASMLHDVAHDREWNDGVDHAVVGSEDAKRYLNTLPNERVELISQAILEHMGKKERSTILGKILADADRLAYTPRDAAWRAYNYRKSKGLSEAEALRKAYWHTRTSGSIHRPATLARLELPESRALAQHRIDSFDKNTKSFKDFQKLLGIKNPADYVQKEASSMDNRVDELMSKLAWIEVAAPGIMNTPFTKNLVERGTRKIVRSNTRNATFTVATDQPVDDKEEGAGKHVSK